MRERWQWIENEAAEAQSEVVVNHPGLMKPMDNSMVDTRLCRFLLLGSGCSMEIHGLLGKFRFIDGLRKAGDERHGFARQSTAEKR